MKHQTPGYFERDIVDFQQFFKKTTEAATVEAQTSNKAQGIIHGFFKNLFPVNKRKSAQQGMLGNC